MADIYIPVQETEVCALSERMSRLVKFFRQEYGIEPHFLVRVPGRVNLIGEHIDYCGYPVLPMAIEQCILLAVARNTDRSIRLRNLNEKYVSFKCGSDEFNIEITRKNGPLWYNYFLCGVKGILEYVGGVSPAGLTVAVDGNIPPASGLSSSSALVSAAILATAFILNVPLNAKKLASLSAKCERYIGTQGGGMDQAIAFLGKSGCAQFIHFYPELNNESVRLPNNATFVIANSLAEMNKAATSYFNERVMECRVSCCLLGKKLKVKNWKDIKKFIVLQSTINCTLEDLEKLAKLHLDKEVYSRKQILEELQITEEELETGFLTSNTIHMESFKLRQRTLHVIQESMRVLKFKAASEADSCNLKTLSELMKQSHESLRSLYECSHPCLDKLIEISASLNTGARLTGAGWGGCIVAMCDSMESCQLYIKELKQRYYKDLPQAKGRDLDDLVFATSPQRGAELLLLK